MYTFTQYLMQSADQVGEALKHEPVIRPSFVRADLRTILVVMFNLMQQNINTASAIYRYLEARGCPFDRNAIDFLLNAYTGEDPEQHLWTRQLSGDFHALLEALPLPTRR